MSPGNPEDPFLRFKPGAPFKKGPDMQTFLKGDVRKEATIRDIETLRVGMLVRFKGDYGASTEADPEVRRKRELFPPKHRWKIESEDPKTKLFTIKPLDTPEWREKRKRATVHRPLTPAEEERDAVIREGVPGIHRSKLAIVDAT